MGNIGVLAGNDGIVLVDSQLVELGPKIEAALKTISDKPVKYVINAHWHGDHTGGNAYWGKTAVLIAAADLRLDADLHLRVGPAALVAMAADP